MKRNSTNQSKTRERLAADSKSIQIGIKQARIKRERISSSSTRSSNKRTASSDIISEKLGILNTHQASETIEEFIKLLSSMNHDEMVRNNHGVSVVLNYLFCWWLVARLYFILYTSYFTRYTIIQHHFYSMITIKYYYITR